MSECMCDWLQIVDIQPIKDVWFGSIFGIVRFTYCDNIIYGFIKCSAHNVSVKMIRLANWLQYSY